MPSPIISPIWNAALRSRQPMWERADERALSSQARHVTSPAAAFHAAAHKPRLRRHESEEDTSRAALASRLQAPEWAAGVVEPTYEH